MPSVTARPSAPAQDSVPDSSSDVRARRTRELFAQVSERAPQARQDLYDELVLLNLPVADALARRYASRGLALDDLTQVARLALVRVVPQFRPEFGRDFLTYAVPSILGALRRHFRDTAWTVRPPRRIQEAQQLMRQLRPDLVQRLGREPTVAEVCAESGLDEETVLEALSVDGCFTPASLDRVVGPGDDLDASPLGDFLGAEDPDLERCEARVLIEPLLHDLDPRDRRVLQLRFVEGLTQREVGEQIGVTQMQVSRILTRVLAGLRERLGELVEPAA